MREMEPGRNQLNLWQCRRWLFSPFSVVENFNYIGILYGGGFWCIQEDDRMWFQSLILYIYAEKIDDNTAVKTSWYSSF